MNKKICHITSAHSRYDVRIFVKECASLSRSGYNVTLIVNDKLPDEINKGVNIISTKLDPKNRIERFLKSGKLLLNKAIEVNADIYHLHDPDLLPIGNKLKKIGKKVIFDSHEDVPCQIKDKQWIPIIIRSFISKIYEVYEKYSLKRYDYIISVTPHIVKRLRTINLNTAMITNYPIIDMKENIYRRPTNAICFAGGISEQWSHINIIKAIEQIENIRYILAGSGSVEYLNTLKSLNGWKKVDYLGMVPHSEVKNSIYSISLAGMTLLSNDNQVGDEGTLGNTKIFEFMEAGLPIICSNNRLWRQIIDEYSCGITVNPDNVGEIRNAIEYIIKNLEKAKIMGENGRRAVIEKYNWKTQEKILSGLYRKLV